MNCNATTRIVTTCARATCVAGLVVGMVAVAHGQSRTPGQAGSQPGPSQSQVDELTLRQLAAQWAESYAAGHAAAEAWARQTGARLRYEAPDGRIVEIVYLRDGRPVAYGTHNADAGDTVGADELWPGGSSGLGLTGTGVLLHEWDGGGVRTSHQEFAGRVTQQDSPAELSDHSTHVAGTIVAAGLDAWAHGMSPAATLDAYEWNNDEAEMAAAAGAGARVSNHSYGFVCGWDWGPHPTDPTDPDTYAYWWGDLSVSATEDGDFGYYDQTCKRWDTIAYLAPFYLICKSSGNDRNDTHTGGHWVWSGGAWTWSTDARDPDGGATGYDCIPPRGCAKNLLTVGAVDDVPGGYSGPGGVVMSSFSSWGPTDDGRIKPDLVGNGVDLYSASSAADDAYTWKGGTSMSTPNVAGAFGLLIEHYRGTHGGNDMRAATLKGLAIHTADECGPADGPDYMFGWGLLNALAAAEEITRDVAVPGAIQELSIADGATVTYSFEYSGVGPIKATICWTDVPGDPVPLDRLDPPDPMLVNDLDLRVEGPAKAIYRPWVLDPANPAVAATTGDNFRDNVEVVEIPSPAPGTYEVRITHKGQLTGAPQAFSLLVTGQNRPPVAVCISDPLTLEADQDCCVTVGVADVDDGSFDPDGPAGIDTLCITAVDGDPVGCQQTVQLCGTGAHEVTLTITDLAGESDSCTATVQVEDSTPPEITCSAVGGEVDENCEFLVTFNALVTDNCCLRSEDVDVNVALPTANATLSNLQIAILAVSDKVVSVSGSVLVSDLTSCPATVRVRVDAADCAGNVASPCAALADVVDVTPPEITCPPDALFEHGNFFCNEGEVLDWLNSATATDNCDPDVEIVHDAPACGFPPDSVTVVTWTATDDCGNSAQCSATVTIPPLDLGQPGIKGSLLVYPDVEVRWDGAGTLVQDTFLTLSNDVNAEVYIHAYFVSETCTSTDVDFVLTRNEPAYWSAASGLPLGVSPWTVLGAPYADPEGSGDLIARGYIVLWAVNAEGQEIRWNHLFGAATLVDYRAGTAWEYQAWAYPTDCVPHGEQPLDCIAYDASGTCCDALVIPGSIDFDGFHHDMTPDRLLLDFIASGALAWSTGTATVRHDTDLTLLVMEQDLRQDGAGPAITKAQFDIWNDNEVGFSGAQRCVTKWDQVLLSTLGGHFLRGNLQTDLGYARINGVGSIVCPDSADAALIGVSNRILTIDGQRALSGRSLWLRGREAGGLLYDVPQPPEGRSVPAGEAASAADPQPVEATDVVELRETTRGQ